MKHLKRYNEQKDEEDKLTKLKSLVDSFNREDNLESKYQKSIDIKNFLADIDRDSIEGVDDGFLWDTFNSYGEILGSFATAHVYVNEMNDGMEMSDVGYIFDYKGFFRDIE